MTSVWMWPQQAINSDTIFQDEKTLIDIESFFTKLYEPYKILYFSRARLALTAISAAQGLSRPQLTFVQPFSSHCVLSAISPLSTPTTLAPENSQQQVVYHQWGHKQVVKPTVFSSPIVEDAVDSIITSAKSSELFPNNAPFCLFSLPKISQTSIGAIVVCREPIFYHKLLKQRDTMISPVNNQLELINEPALREAVLAANPLLVPKVDDISRNFYLSEKTIRKNLAVIGDIFDDLNLYLPNEERLPSNIVIDDSLTSSENLYSRVPFEVQEKQRTFYDYQSLECKRVWLLPCHAQARWG